MDKKKECVLGTELSVPLTKWWLKVRPCKSAIQINANQGIPPCIEFYVPFWAWPFELLHRLYCLIFGKDKLS